MKCVPRPGFEYLNRAKSRGLKLTCRVMTAPRLRVESRPAPEEVGSTASESIALDL